MRTRRSIGVLDMTYPVARILSITSRIFRLLALWAGSDRPTPRGSVVEVDIPSDVSSVVVKELMEENEDVLLLWGLWNIGPLEF